MLIIDKLSQEQYSPVQIQDVCNRSKANWLYYSDHRGHGGATVAEW